MPSVRDILGKRPQTGLSVSSILDRQEPVEGLTVEAPTIPEARTEQRIRTNRPILQDIIGAGGFLAGMGTPLPTPPTPDVVREIRGQLRSVGDFAAENTEAINAELDRLLGVRPAPFRGDRPLTEEEQRFRDIGSIGEDVPIIGPAIGETLQGVSDVARTLGRFGTGAAGFVAGAPRFAALEPGEAGEEIRGLGQTFATVLPSAETRIRGAFGVPGDPSAEVDPNAPLSQFQEFLTGEPFTQEEFQRLANLGVSEAPESPLFGVALAAGGVRGAGRSVKAILKRTDRARVAPVEPPPVSRKAAPEVIEPSGAEPVQLPGVSFQPIPKQELANFSTVDLIVALEDRGLTAKNITRLKPDQMREILSGGRLSQPPAKIPVPEPTAAPAARPAVKGKDIAKGLTGGAAVGAITAGISQLEDDQQAELAGLAAFAGATVGRIRSRLKGKPKAAATAEAVQPRQTQPKGPRKAKKAKVESDTRVVAEAQSNFATPEMQAELYPLVVESRTGAKGQFLPATDAQLATYTGKTPAEFTALSKSEQSALRKLYSKERAKQKAARKLDEANRKDFNIEPDPELRKRLAEPPPDVPDAELVKDISKAKQELRDPFRNFEEALPAKVAETLTEKRDAAGDGYARFLKDELDRHAIEVEKDIGVKPGSKMDRAVQEFGEGNLTLDQITKKFGPDGAKKIVDAAAWYRARYEDFLRQYNSTMANLYPGDATKLIRRRQNYFRHFRELGDLTRLLDVVEEAGGIARVPAGIARFVRPAIKKLGIAKRRLINSKTDLSAAGGYADYIQQVGYGIHINPMAKYMRQFERNMEKAYGPTNTIPNFRTSFREWVDGLTGTPNMLEVFMRKALGPGWEVINVLNQRAKQNIILGNLGAVAAQPFNVPQAAAQMGPKNFASGIRRTLGGIFTKPDTNPQTRSRFLNERYLESNFSKYRFGMVNKARSTAAWILRTADEIFTRMIRNGFLEQALRENKPNPGVWADRMTRKMVAGRSVGELPNLQRNKLFQMVAPFQVEVGNAMWAFVDLPKGQKKFSKVATFVLASYMMNRVAEEVRGTPVSFDPLQALIEGLQIAFDERRGTFERVGAIPGRLAGEVLSNVPLGQTAAALYPKFGAKIPGTDIKLPTRKGLFGSNDPTRYGSTVLFFDAIQDPVSRLLLPFGGVQARKTVTGMKALAKGEVSFGKKTLKIKQTGVNTVKALLFGPFATTEARKFFKNRDQSITKNTMLDYLSGERKAGNFDVSEKAKRAWNRENPTKKITTEAIRKHGRKK